jgi:hypothetical protein
MAYKMQVIISEEMKERLEKYCKMTGVSMSSMCNVFIGQGLMAYDKTFDIVDAIKSKMLSKVDSKPGEVKGQLEIEDIIKAMTK